MSLTDGEKEQIKLTSTYMNGIAIGMVLIGGLSLPITMSVGAADAGTRIFAILISLCSFAGSPYLHYQARRNLRKVDRDGPR